MTALLDLGNSRLKWAPDSRAEVLQVRAQTWDALQDDAALEAFFDAVEPGQPVLAASVLDAQREARVGAALQARGAGKLTWVRTPAEACGVRNAYPQPGRLGVDRFLGMVAALHAGHAPCVVVSVGTALTLDALAIDGRHLGGLIAPGPGLMQRSLHAATAQLPEPDLMTLVDSADHTEAAIVSGCWQAAIALVERYHARMSGPLGATPELVLSGGAAPALLDHLAVAATLQPDAVLWGLSVWAGDRGAET